MVDFDETRLTQVADVQSRKTEDPKKQRSFIISRDTDNNTQDPDQSLTKKRKSTLNHSFAENMLLGESQNSAVSMES